MENSITSFTNKNTTHEQRQSIYQALLQESLNGELRKGSIHEVSSLFSVSPKTVSRIWHQATSQIDQGLNVNFSSKMPTNVGRKKVQIDMDEVSQIPLRLRTKVRCLAKSVNVSKSTMHRRIKEGVLRPHTNAIKPSLTSENKKARLEFCLSKINRSLSSSSMVFYDTFDVVHIDKKMFYMSRPSKSYYLVPGEKEPLRTCKSKKFMTKVMFLAAVARSRYDASGNEVFSGKIGIYPLTTLEPAKRSSKNRVARTLETKPILSVNKQIKRSWLIQKVLPDIRAKWSRGHTGPIYIQQDNAKPHIDINDSEFLEAASRDGFDIRLCVQPPNIPDLNVLDLGFFRAIQSLQEQEVLGNVDKLVHVVLTSFESMQSNEFNNVFFNITNMHERNHYDPGRQQLSYTAYW